MSDLGRIYNLLEMVDTEPEAKVRRVFQEEQEHILLTLIPLATSQALLGVLADDFRPRIRAKLAENVYLSAELLERLADCDDEEVLCAVASHPITPSGVLVRLSASAYHLVRRDAVRNDSLPLERVYALLDDKSFVVANGAATALSERPDSDYAGLPEYMKTKSLLGR